MKSRDCRDVLSVLRLKKRYTKQVMFSLNNNTALPGKGNIKMKFFKSKTYFNE